MEQAAPTKLIRIFRSERPFHYMFCVKIAHLAYGIQLSKNYEEQMKIVSLGHVALKVTDIIRSRALYHDVLGLPYAEDPEGKSMVFFRSDEHHNLALFQVDSLDEASSTLDHIAFRLEGGSAELRSAQAELEAISIDVNPYEHTDQNVSSIYFKDFDGNQIELYVRRS